MVRIFSVQDKFAINNLMLSVSMTCWVNATTDHQVGLIIEDEINAKNGFRR